MALTFDGATQYALNGSAGVTSHPLTMAAWFKTSITNGFQSIAFLNDSTGTTSQTRCYGLTLINTQKARFESNAATATTTVSYTANAWQHICGTTSAANQRTVYLNGANSVSNVSSTTVSGINQTMIGVMSNAGGQFDLFTGSIAEFGVWNVVLTSDEITALSRGVSPWRVRPNQLVSYFPVWGIHSPEIDYTSGVRSLTLTGSPTRAADHPPILKLWRKPSVFDLPVPETVTLDKWHAASPQPFERLEAVGY